MFCMMASVESVVGRVSVEPGSKSFMTLPTRHVNGYTRVTFVPAVPVVMRNSRSITRDAVPQPVPVALEV